MSEFNLLDKKSFDTLEEVQKALAEPFPIKELKQRKSWYFIPVERIRQRLIQVLGVDAFDIEYSEVQHHDEDWITVTCTLTVDFTKWGGRIKKSTQAEGIQIKRFTEGEKQGLIVDLGNDYKTVMSGALTKAAQDLGIGLYIPLLGKNLEGHNNNNNNNTSNQNKATDKQRKIIYACEQTIGIDKKTKKRIFDRLFPEATDDQIDNPTIAQADKYIKTIQPVSFIIQNIRNSNVEEQEIFKLLSHHFNREIKSYVSLITLANFETVNHVKSWLKKQSA